LKGVRRTIELERLSELKDKRTSGTSHIEARSTTVSAGMQLDRQRTGDPDMNRQHHRFGSIGASFADRRLTEVTGSCILDGYQGAHTEGNAISIK